MWLGSVIKNTHQLYDPSEPTTTKLTMRDEQMVAWIGNTFPLGFTSLANHGG
jgi:hypothetical protein